MGCLVQFVFMVGAAVCVAGGAEDAAAVAHYDFDEGVGTVLHDRTGNGNDGRIHRARWVKRGAGFCLAFNGVDSYVDCGAGPTLNLTEAGSLEVWVYPARRVSAEPGIAGKHFSSYLLTYYRNGRCYWYITSGGNNASGLLTTGGWHHVVGTFAHAELVLYVDGAPVGRRTSRYKAADPGKRFLLGCVMGDPAAADPAYTRTAYFPGMMDEVSVFRRALTAEEVRQRFERGIRKLALHAHYEPVKPSATVRYGYGIVKVGAHGEVEVTTPTGSCVVTAAYSYPGRQIGYNRLAAHPSGSEPSWTPNVRRGDAAVAITAQGRFYSLKRTVTVSAGRVRFDDELTNLRTVPTGVLIENRLVVPEPFADAFAVGGAENPTIFLRRAHDALGVVMEDSVSRNQWEPRLGLPRNQAKFRLGNFALAAGERCTLSWTVYLLAAGGDYFDFLNQVRRDWGTNFTLLGPFSFFDVGRQARLLADPPALKAYLKRKRLGIVALSPWLDYDPGSFDHVWSRPEYKRRMRQARQVFRRVDPTIQVIGCIETDWVTIHPEQMNGGDKLPRAVPGKPRPSGRLTPEQTKIVDAAALPWKDSVKRDAQGNLELELYVRGGKAQTALSVYPAVGNHQYRFLLDQVKFLLEEVGLDGFYIDEFSQGWGGTPQRTYVGWDGRSVDLDPITGRISRKFVDCSLAGIEARVNLCRYALERGKLVVANTYPTAREEQALPVQRFSETWGVIDPLATPEGKEPPPVIRCFRGLLASPLGLGVTDAGPAENVARRLMKTLLVYLRHGMVYYHYVLRDIPPDQGGYGPVNHLFPLTPVGLHKGWIEGKERLVSCVSGRFRWRGAEKPAVHLFDLTGRAKPAHVVFRRGAPGWTVELDLHDWAEVAVIEPPGDRP